MNTKKPTETGCLSVIVFFIIIGYAVSSLRNCFTGGKKKAETPPVQEIQRTPPKQEYVVPPEIKGKYRIASTKDVSFPTVKRYVYNVVVTGEPTKAELTEIAYAVFEEAKKRTPFNALSVVFYDYECLIYHGVVMGNADFAPDGDWGKAMDVKTGDYSTMKIDNEIEEPYWPNAVTEREAEIYAEFETALFKDATVDENAVASEFAEKYGMTEKEFHDLCIRVVARLRK